MLSYRIHGNIFPWIHPIVKAVLSDDLHGICFVSLDFADGTVPTLLDEQRIQDTDIDLVQCRRNWLIATPDGLH